MKKTAIILAVILIIGVLPVTSSAATEDWSEAYQTFVMEEGYLSSGGFVNYQMFGLHDMDNNGIPELLISIGAYGGAMDINTAYTYTGGRVVSLGTVGGVSYSLSDSRYPGLYSEINRMGYHSESYYYVKEGAIHTEIVLLEEQVFEDNGISWVEKSRTEDTALYNACKAGIITIIKQYTLSEIRGMTWDVFVSETVPSFEPWQEAYLRVLQSQKMFIGSFTSEFGNNHPVAIYDICGDTTPELIYLDKGLSANAVTRLSIWTYKNGVATEITDDIHMEDRSGSDMGEHRMFALNDGRICRERTTGWWAGDADAGWTAHYDLYSLDSSGNITETDRLTVTDGVKSGDPFVSGTWNDREISGSEASNREADIRSKVESLLLTMYVHNDWASSRPFAGMSYADAITALSTPLDPIIARPTSSIVLVNGKNTAFDAYNINDNNYFKLRDLAYILSGSQKQFEVAWDAANNAIILTSGKPYSAVGGEMTEKGSGSKTPIPTSATIYLDDRIVWFTAYNIDGNNYFKLRDVGQAFDFGVDWDGARNTIVIDTSIGYTP